MSKSIKSANIGKIKIGNNEYDIYIAKSKELKERGLQFFRKLPSNEGMLFVINELEPMETSFHMHNVPFPLDMIFMDDEFNVLDIKKGEPEEDLIKGIASYVLEVNADSGIKVGDSADLDDEDTNEYTMKVLNLQGNSLMDLVGGERIISRKETVVLIKKALKANSTKEDRDYKALGKYMFKILKGLDSRSPEYITKND